LSGALQIARYECTLRHLGNFLGNMRHWQQRLSKCSTAQNTSNNATRLGVIF
jgi:hypothetical protein